MVHLIEVQSITPAKILEVPVAAHRLMKFSLRMICGMVNDVLNDVVDVRKWQFKVDCWHVQGHQNAGTVENGSSMYHSLGNGFCGFRSDQA